MHSILRQQSRPCLPSGHVFHICFQKSGGTYTYKSVCLACNLQKTRLYIAWANTGRRVIWACSWKAMTCASLGHFLSALFVSLSPCIESTLFAFNGQNCYHRKNRKLDSRVILHHFNEVYLASTRDVPRYLSPHILGGLILGVIEDTLVFSHFCFKN